MISDPIDILGTTIVQDHFRIYSDLLFVSVDTSVVSLIRGCGDSVWAITRYGESGRAYHDCSIGEISKERFVEYMAEEYPDYLEWLLFHPEWLG